MKKNNKVLYMMLLPVLAYIVVFKFIPLLGNIIAFQDYSFFKGIFSSEWVGLKHFERLFTSKIFYNVVWNTLKLNILNILIVFPFTILLAVMLVEIKERFRKWIQVLLYIPYFISWAALGGIIIHILSPSIGIPAAFGTLFGVSYDNLPFLMGNSTSWIGVFVLSSIWQSAGYGSIVFVAAILNIDKRLYQAAEIDGASKWQQTLHITLPAIKLTIAVMFILKIGSILSLGFEQIYALSNSMVYDVSDVLSTYEYRIGLQGMQYSFATALGICEGIVGFVLVIITNYIVKKMSGGDNGIW